MNYSVFILFGNDKGKVDQFTGNTDFLTHAKAGATDAVSNTVGFEVGDTYADKLENEKSVALTGNVTEMTFHTEVISLTNYPSDTHNGYTATLAKNLKHTLTVKGTLEYPDTLFGMGVSTAKKKDTSRIWEWANTALGTANDQNEDIKAKYYRDVVATVFASDDRQFRAIVLKDAFVNKYEEYFDTNGEGHFTLVINKLITIVNPNDANREVSAEGPEFSQTFSSVMGDVAQVASTAGNITEDTANVLDEVLGKDNVVSKGAHKVADHLDKASEDIQSGLSDGSAWNLDNISKEIADHAENVNEWKNQTDQTTTDTKTEILADGSTKTTVTITNPDGSKDITTTTKSADGETETVEKQHKEAPGLIKW